MGVRHWATAVGALLASRPWMLGQVFLIAWPSVWLGQRIGIGAAALVAPGVIARPWIGRDADDSSTAVLSRALAGRDLALGIGLIVADHHDQHLRGWVEAGALADLVDSAITLAAFRNLPRRGRLAVLAAARGAAVGGFFATRCL